MSEIRGEGVVVGTEYEIRVYGYAKLGLRLRPFWQRLTPFALAPAV